MNDLKLIGRKDKADFPEFDIQKLDVKIDSGAYTSSIYCSRLEHFYDGGKEFVRFTLLNPKHRYYTGQLLEYPVWKKKVVKSSSGHREERYMIKTTIQLFDELIPLTLSLTDRRDMRYPVLLGRRLLKNRFIIDVSKTNLSHKAKKKKQS